MIISLRTHFQTQRAKHNIGLHSWIKHVHTQHTHVTNRQITSSLVHSHYSLRVLCDENFLKGFLVQIILNSFDYMHIMDYVCLAVSIYSYHSNL